MTPQRTKQAIEKLAPTPSKADIGLGDVDNIKQASKVEFDSHKDDKNNPHSVTKEQVGLSNVDNVKQVKKSGDTMDGDLGVDGNVRTKELIINHPNNEDDPRFKFVYNTNGDLEIWANADGTWEQRAVLGHRYNNGVFTIGGKDVETTEGSLDKVNNVMDWIKDYGIGSNARSANFDTVNKTGFYGFTGGTKPFSTGMAFYGYHLQRSSDYASQFAITSDGYRAFYRGKTTSGWNKWHEMVTKEQLEEAVNNLKNHTGNKNNPHNVTKSQVGLSNVDNVQQATKSEFKTHVADTVRHITANERNTWNAKETPSGAQAKADKAKQDAINWADSNINAGKINVIPTKPGSAAPKTYPMGITIFNVDNGDEVGYPNKLGVVTTFRLYNHRTYQTFHTKDNTGFFTRGVSDNGDSWEAWQKIATVEYVYSHISNKSNPHNVTKSQIGLGNVDNIKQETPSGAQKKANEVKNWVKDYSIGTSLQHIDPNVVNETGFYVFTENTPTSDGAYYGYHLERSIDWAAQFVMRGGTDKAFFRTKNLGKWQEWHEVVQKGQLEEVMSDLNSHIGNKNNPHNVDKRDVGLGNVENYNISTQSEAEEGEDSYSYMTPLRTKQAINTIAPTTVTKEKLGIEGLETDPDPFDGSFNFNAKRVEVGGIGIGSSSIAGKDSTAIGVTAEADGDRSVALGVAAYARGAFGIAIGPNAEVLQYSTASISIGLGAISERGHSIALGSGATAYNDSEGVFGGNPNEGGPHKWKVPGSFTVEGTKNFEMPHPYPDKKDTHRLRHSAVEAPTAGDNLYRYTVEAKYDGETVELELPDYFQYLNKNVDVWVNGYKHFGRAFGEVEGNILKVTCENAGKYKCLVIGTRNDDHPSIQSWDIKGVEREIGESWTGETYAFEVNEIMEIDEMREEL